MLRLITRRIKSHSDISSRDLDHPSLGVISQLIKRDPRVYPPAASERYSRCGSERANERARIKDARRAPLWSRMKREGSGPRRKCGMVCLRPRTEVTKRRRRPAARGRRYPRPHPRLLSLARSFLRLFSLFLPRVFLFLSPPSLSLSFSTTKRNDSFSDISAALDQPGERICIPSPTRLHACSTCESRSSLARSVTHSLTRSLLQLVLPIPQERRGNPPR